MLKERIFVDGSFKNYVGTYAVIRSVVLSSGTCPCALNHNDAELYAVEMGIKAAKEGHVSEVYTDSLHAARFFPSTTQSDIVVHWITREHWGIRQADIEARKAYYGNA